MNDEYNLKIAREDMDLDISAGKLKKKKLTQQERETYREWKGKMQDVAKIEASLANPCRAHKLGLKTVNQAKKWNLFVKLT